MDSFNLLKKMKKSISLDYEYLEERKLTGFNNYKYSSVDTNPLSIYIMHPFWNKVVQLCPSWIAPNLLTFLGFVLTALAAGILALYDYDFSASSDTMGGGDNPGGGYAEEATPGQVTLLSPHQGPIPDWVFMACSLLIFVAYTLDGIDGKQARRTGTSGPLGELFDHGLDSWTASLIPVCLYSVFGREPPSVNPLRYYAVCWNVFLTFYLTHWEKYNTGVLFLPWGYDLSMISATMVFFVTYFVGCDSWKVKLTDSISSGQLLEIVFYLTSLMATLPVVLWNIRVSYREGTGKNRPLREAVRPLYPVFIQLALSASWLLVSPPGGGGGGGGRLTGGAAGSLNDSSPGGTGREGRFPSPGAILPARGGGIGGSVIERHPRAFYMLTGTIFSNITCRLVVAQMSGSRASAFNWFLIPKALSILLIGISGSVLLETFLLHFLWFGLTLAHIHYGTCVVRQMCRHFDIDCFTIRKKKKNDD